jgi:hypothetical protein
VKPRHLRGAFPLRESDELSSTPEATPTRRRSLPHRRRKRPWRSVTVHCRRCLAASIWISK